MIDYLIAENGGHRLTYLINDQGISLYNITKYENQNALKIEHSTAGQACFSPDGKMYAKYNSHTGIDIFDFDRSTGLFSNYRHVETNFALNYSGAAFSPNGRFLYISKHDRLDQLDLWEENLEDGLELIDVYDGYLDPFPTNFTWMQIGPDCKIYMTSTNGVSSYHVINDPNEKGQACDFVQHGFDLPIQNGTACIPNFPVFRFDGDDICDPTITSVFDIPVEVVHNLDIYPNPTTDQVVVRFPEDLRDGVLYVKSMNGQVMLQQEFQYSGSLQVELGEYDAGIYFIEVVSGGTYYRDRVVKVD